MRAKHFMKGGWDRSTGSAEDPDRLGSWLGAMAQSNKGEGADVAPPVSDLANGVVIKIYGEETKGAFSSIEQPFDPGILLPPPVHENDVRLYVIEGETFARVGEEDVEATADGWVLKPRRIPHTMRNAGPEPARIIELYTPGGFELFFKDFGERLGKGPIGLDELNRLGGPHGIRFFNDWILELKAVYNLRLVSE